MKLKPLILSLAVLTAFTFSACDNGKESSQPAETTSSIASSELEQDVSNFESNAISDLDFDFDAAIQNIELFGNKISLPCTFKEFGSDFELYEDISIPISDEENKLRVMIKYKGGFIGSVVLDCQLDDENKVEKQVVGLTLGDSSKNIPTNSNWYNELIELDFSGITYSSTESEVKEKLGTPASTEDAYFDERFAYYKSETEWLKIGFKENKITEFNLRIG